jgi:hypothetical protein
VSHYARLIREVSTATVATGERLLLAVGTAIRNVRLDYKHEYGFEAQLPVGRGWIEVITDEDLPAFTDKGSSHRARKVHATLQPGRPLTGEEHVRAIAFRPTQEQSAWLQKRCVKHDLTMSEMIREALHKIGMPR